MNRSRRNVSPQLICCPECLHPHRYDIAIERGVLGNVELLLGTCPNCGTNHTEKDTAFRASDTYQFPNFLLDDEDVERLQEYYNEQEDC